jgi:serine/threonine protein phosphatase PrpC
MTVLRAAAETHTGYVRSTNQDLALVSGDLVAVADGMGGHLGGEVAARTAIEELLESYLRERTADGLVSAARRANRAVWRKSRVDRKLHGMGTTLTAAALVDGAAVSDGGNAEAGALEGAGALGGAGAGEGGELGDGAGRGARLILVNVGDSRAYVLDRSSHRLRQLTDDHSVVEEMVRQGELTPEEASVHPHRHVLTRALGIEPEVALDVWDLEAQAGSRFLLCSDGLTNEVSDEEIADVLAAAADPEQAVRELVGRALGHGGMDNVTVVVADVVEGDADMAIAPELVPPRPPRPEAPVMGTPELTEAVPISPPAPLPAPAPSGAPPVSSPEDRSAGPDTGATAAMAFGAADLASVSETQTLAEALPVEKPRRKNRSMTVRAAPTPPAIDGVIDAGGLVRSGPGTGTSGVGAVQAPRREVGAPADELGGSHATVVLVRRRRERATRDRIVTVRVALFVLLLAGLLGGTVGVIIWYDQTSYFIGLHGDSVAIYEGRPDGMLWFKPQLIETSAVKTSDLLPSTIATLRGGITESSLAAAENVTNRLKGEKANALAAATTTSTTTTSSTTPKTTVPGTLPSATVPQTTQPPPTTQAPPTTQPPPTSSTPTTTSPPATTTTQGNAPPGALTGSASSSMSAGSTAHGGP